MEREEICKASSVRRMGVLLVTAELCTVVRPGLPLRVVVKLEGVVVPRGGSASETAERHSMTLILLSVAWETAQRRDLWRSETTLKDCDMGFSSNVTAWLRDTHHPTQKQIH